MSCRTGPRAGLCKQPLIDKAGLVPVLRLGKSKTKLTEAEEGQVDGPPTNEGAKSRDIDKPAFGWNLMRKDATTDIHL